MSFVLSFLVSLAVCLCLCRKASGANGPALTVRSHKDHRITTMRSSHSWRLKTLAFAEASGMKPIMVWASNGTALFKAVLDSKAATLSDCDRITAKNIVAEFDAKFDQEMVQLSTLSDIDIQNAEDASSSTSSSAPKFASFDSVSQECMSFHEGVMSRLHEIKVSNRRQRRRKRELSKWIWPGTKWCGHGNIAADDKDFGVRAEMDKCCWDHDRCPYAITGFETRYGYSNWQLHTLSHCDCDFSFFECLSNATETDPGAKYLGEFYFNFIQTSCFVLEMKPICTEYTWWGTCNRKELGIGASIKATPTF